MRKKPFLKTFDMTAKNAVAPPSGDRKTLEQICMEREVESRVVNSIRNSLINTMENLMNGKT